MCCSLIAPCSREDRRRDAGRATETGSDTDNSPALPSGVSAHGARFAVCTTVQLARAGRKVGIGDGLTALACNAGAVTTLVHHLAASS
jgi:hypothetical protein